MYSVTGRVKSVKQPRGGYISPKQFAVAKAESKSVVSGTDWTNFDGNVHASIVGLVVDYFTRYMLGEELLKAFEIPCTGAILAEKLRGYEKASDEAYCYLNGIKQIDDESITNACKLVTFDVWCRSPKDAEMAKRAAEINPDESTLFYITVMILRCLSFWEKYGPIVKSGFTFDGAYTNVVSRGDGDYLTKDTLWDVKVSKNPPTSKHTLQLLMYWIMGQHTGKKEFVDIGKLGIFNPKSNLIYTLNVADIPSDTIKVVEREVICY